MHPGFWLFLVTLCLTEELAGASRDSVLKHVKENEQKKKKAKEKGAWVQLKRQNVPLTEAHFVRTDEKEPELLELVHYEFIAL
ncbi:60S ribosomal protein L21 [Tupaia chinensis]|uniref:60S ribosomal protein L21 n=1 Tax=Tupaia chinensis TaxID=246437 RepID=L9LA13_TUPCH|nr:60S ribosomal protein L21 [Tupaia chinensis]